MKLTKIILVLWSGPAASMKFPTNLTFHAVQVTIANIRINGESFPASRASFSARPSTLEKSSRISSRWSTTTWRWLSLTTDLLKVDLSFWCWESDRKWNPFLPKMANFSRNRIFCVEECDNSDFYDFKVFLLHSQNEGEMATHWTGEHYVISSDVFMKCLLLTKISF